jgi:hypothetical protein
MTLRYDTLDLSVDDNSVLYKHNLYRQTASVDFKH